MRVCTPTHTYACVILLFSFDGSNCDRAENGCRVSRLEKTEERGIKEKGVK
jgi:hypothetical protein